MTDFHTYTLFANDKSIVGNTCAQIFTGGEFVKIIPVRSKSEAGTTLDWIHQDVGFASKIFMDNAPNQTGYNTEIQRMEILASMEVRTTEPYSP